MCNVIWVTISEDVFLSLDCDETVWRDVANGFMTRTNFPHCVGAIDGKQVRVELQGKLNLHPLEEVSDNLIPLPYVFIGDEAFGISTNLMRPYASYNLTVPKRIFNYRLCRARRYVECSFGILSNKWRIFHRPLNIDVKVAISLIKACCALHNFVRDRSKGFHSMAEQLYIKERTEPTADNAPICLQNMLQSQFSLTIM
nr:unnamed protein product [Callosobruchus analis]